MHADPSSSPSHPIEMQFVYTDGTPFDIMPAYYPGGFEACKTSGTCCTFGTDCLFLYANGVYQPNNQRSKFRLLWRAVTSQHLKTAWL